MLKPIARRAALASLAGCLAASATRAALPVSLPDQPVILVAGPQGGLTDAWAGAIATALGRSLQQGGPLVREHVGGPDGVTGANQFQARTAPDGSTAMLVPGEAALSWLTGDTRVSFDAGRWTPLWGGETSAAVATRAPLVAGRRLRVGVHSVVGPELAALLALYLMGIDVEPVRLDPANDRPFAHRGIDLLFLRGASLRDDAAALPANGWLPAFGFGMTAADGQLVRDPMFPNLPIAQELITRPRRDNHRALAAALPAVATAATLDIALVLPQPSPAAVVAWWRQGCTALATAPAVQTEAARSLCRPIGAGAIAANVATITVDPAVLLELRHWLAERYRWRPS